MIRATSQICKREISKIYIDTLLAISRNEILAPCYSLPPGPLLISPPYFSLNDAETTQKGWHSLSSPLSVYYVTRHRVCTLLLLSHNTGIVADNTNLARTYAGTHDRRQRYPLPLPLPLSSRPFSLFLSVRMSVRVYSGVLVVTDERGGASDRASCTGSRGISGARLMRYGRRS